LRYKVSATKKKEKLKKKLKKKKNRKPKGSLEIKDFFATYAPEGLLRRKTTRKNNRKKAPYPFGGIPFGDRYNENL
jgi:hypothetical protein